MNSIAPTTTTTTLSRFIPAEEGTSLSNDAPGYYGGKHSLNNGDDEYGPACWSCKGTGSKVKKVKISVDDDEAMNAGIELSRLEGIIPAIETAHAFSVFDKLDMKGKVVVVNLSGRGDKDLETYIKWGKY